MDEDDKRAATLLCAAILLSGTTRATPHGIADEHIAFALQGARKLISAIWVEEREQG